MIKLVDSYIGKTALLGVLAVWFALTSLMSMFTLLDRLGDGTGDTPFGDVMFYVLLKAINSAYVVFPISALLGALIGVGGLAAANELVAFRTAGVSRLRISGSVLGAVLMLTAGVMALGEWALPGAEAQARNLKAGGTKGLVRNGNGMWVRDGQRVISIGRFVVTPAGDAGDVTLLDIEEYEFAPDGGLVAKIWSTSATHDGDRWWLEAVTRVELGAEEVTRSFTPRQSWGVGFSPDLLDSAVVRPRYMSMRAITDQMSYLQQNALDSRAYQSVLWTKILFPINVIALVLAGMPFVFGSARSQSMGLRIFVGMSLGGVFMIVSRGLQNFSEAYAFPAFVGVALPAVVLSLVVILILRRSV